MNRCEPSRKYSFSDLPPDLLLTIADYLKSDSNLPKFRVICKNWRSAVPPPNHTLHPLTPCQISFGSNRPPPRFADSAGPFLLVSTAVYLLRPRSNSHGNSGWLIAVEESKFGKLRLFNPLTKVPVDNLPENFPKFISGFSALKLSEGFNIRLCDDTAPVFRQEINPLNKNKVLLWQGPEYLEGSPQLEGYFLVVLYDIGKLEWFRLSKNKTWVRVPKFAAGIEGIIDDIVTWKSMVYAINRRGNLFRIGYESTEVSDIVVDSGSRGCRRNRLLFDSGGGLYLVVTNKYCDELKIYRLNSVYAVWERIVSLGDKILFVGNDTCFFANSQDLPGFQGNCIVFAKNCFPSYSPWSYDDRSILFQEANGYIEVAMYDYGEGKNVGMDSAFLKVSAVLWPPPQWIRMSGSSYKSAHEVPCVCRCGVPVARKQSWTSRNPGRHFVACKFYNPATRSSGCEILAWVDVEKPVEWQRLVTNQLVLDKKLMERQLEHLKLQICSLVKDNEKLRKKCEKALTQSNEKVNLALSIVIGVFMAASFVVFSSLF